MSEEMKKLLEEEAKKLQETCIINDVVEQVRTGQVTNQTIDIECEVVEGEELFEVYIGNSQTIKVTEKVREEEYVKCEDGSYTTFQAYMVVDDKVFNLFKEKTTQDEFENWYIESKKETWKWLIYFSGSTFFQKQRKISTSSIDHVRLRSDDEDFDEDEEDGDDVLEEVLYVERLDHYVKLSDLIKYEYEIEAGTLVKRVSIEDFKVKLFTKYPYFVDTIKSLYGDNWDINFHRKFNKYCLIVKFDKFTITNSNNQSQEIKDLYFLVPINENLTFNNCLYGGRETLTTVERAANYVHSHLNGAWNGISSFCLGSGPINVYIAEFNVKPDENSLFSVLYNIKIYVEWESLEGTPYKYIANIGKSSTSVNPTLDFTKVYRDYLVDHKLPLKIQVINGFTDIILDQSIIEVQLLDYVEKHKLLKVYKNIALGTYQEQLKIDNLKEELSKDPLLTYKGELIYTKTVKIEQIKIEDQEYVIHPEISKAFISNAIARIRKYNFQKNSGIDPGKSINYYI